MKNFITFVLSFICITSFSQKFPNGEIFFEEEWERKIDSATYYLNRSSLSSATSWIEKAIKISENKNLPAYLTSRLVKATILLEEESLSDAKEEVSYVLNELNENSSLRNQEYDTELIAWHILGLIYKRQKSNKQARHYLELCTESWRKYFDREKAILELGEVLIEEKLFYQAAEYLEGVVKSTKAPVSLAKAHEGLCKTYSELGINERSISNGKKAITIYEDISKSTSLPKAYNILGSVFRTTMMLDSALSYHRKALQVSVDNMNKAGILFSSKNLAIIFDALQEKDSLVKYANHALDAAKETNVAEKVQIKALLCRHFVENERVTEAQKVYSTLPNLDDYWGLLSLKDKISFAENLSKYYKVLGESATTIEGYEILLGLKDSLTKEIANINIVAQRELLEPNLERSLTERIPIRDNMENPSGFPGEPSKSIFLHPVFYGLIIAVVIPFVFYYYREKEKWKRISKRETEKAAEQKEKNKKLEEKLNDPKYQFPEGFISLTNGKHLNYSEIVMIKTSNKKKGKVEFHTTSGDIYEETISLADVVSRLPQTLFMYPHQSNVVNLFHIKETVIGRQEIIMSNNLHAKVARSGKKDLFDLIAKYKIKPAKKD